MISLGLSFERVRVFTTSVLVQHGVPRDRAHIVADALVGTDLRGVDTHEVNRLLIYCERLRKSLVSPNPKLEFMRKTPVIASLDGIIRSGLSLQLQRRMKRSELPKSMV